MSREEFYQSLYYLIRKFFRETEKTSWGKNEIVTKLQQLEEEHLECLQN